MLYSSIFQKSQVVGSMKFREDEVNKLFQLSNHLYCRQDGVYQRRDGVSSALKGEESVFNCPVYK